MNSKKAKQAIQEYLNKKNKETAILINGDWGAGKTFFLRELEKCKFFKDKIVIYISLKSIGCINDIARAIVYEINIKKTGHKIDVSRIGGELISCLSKWLKLDISSNNISSMLIDSILKHTNLSKYVFIFDDLERISKDLKCLEVLYYIHSLLLDNNFNTNVLVVSNKKEIPKYNELEFKNNTDKIISQEIKLEINITDIFDNYINLRYKKSNQLFKKYKDFFEKIFYYVATKNIRKYNQFFDSFIYLHDKMEEIECKDLYFEKILKEICGQLIDLYLKDEDKKEKSKAEKMYPVDYIDFLKINIISLQSVNEYKENGFIDMELFKREINKREEYHEYKETIHDNYMVLVDATDYSNDILIASINKLMQSIEKINSLDLLINIYNYISLYNKIGMVDDNLFKEYKQTIFQKIQSFIENSPEEYEGFEIYTGIPERSEELCNIIQNAVNLKKEQEFESCLEDFKKCASNKKLQRVCANNIKKFMLWLEQNKQIIFNSDFKERLKYLSDIIAYTDLDNNSIFDLAKIVIDSMKEKNHAKETYHFVYRISKDRDAYPFDKSVELLNKKTTTLAK